jgi:dipeptidyl aminopeptidase/acylaminoacyl peptidase
MLESIRSPRRLVLLVAGLLLTLCHGGFAQGTKADYERAATLRERTGNKVPNQKLDAHWLTNKAAFWYRRELPGGGAQFVWVDADKGEKRPAFDHEKLAAALAKASGNEMKPDHLPVENLTLEADGLHLRFRSGGKSWSCDLGSYALHEAPDDSPRLDHDDSARASRRTGAETTLIFDNRTMGGVELFWLDTDGRKKSYGRLGAGERRAQHTFAGHVWTVETREDGRELGRFTATELTAVAEITTERRRDRGAGAPADEPVRGRSPDGKWIAFVRSHNLFLRDRETGVERQLSFDGGLGEAYDERVAWSPDSKKLAAVRVTSGAEHKVYLVESSPPDQLQPKLQSYDYLKPGDKLPHPHPVLFEIPSGRAMPVREELFPNPFTESGGMEIRWEPDSSRFTFVYNQRGHQVLRVIAVDAATAGARALVDEHSETFIDYSGKQYLDWINDTHELIWMSERDGWNHLFLYDALTGRVKNQITKGEWVVRGVDRVDEKKRQVWFRAGGIRTGEDPYQIHHCRVNFDGSGLVILTDGDGSHTVQWSPDQRFLIDTCSRVDLPPVHLLRRAEDGRPVVDLERGDLDDLLKTGWKTPERFTAKGRDGVTDIYGVLYRPSNFDPNRKYPVIEYIYAGPHDSHVPKTFSEIQRGSVMEMAELGFVVVQIDGMGTGNRSKKFHDVCWRNLGDGGFPDRIAWLKAAAAKHPHLDLDRVGIYGGSAGGQNSTRAMLAHGDFYKVAVSDCGCHDNRMDKIWWNEQWMGWPIGPHYEEQSNVTQAAKLRGKLLLIVGELDRNVDPASTMQVVNALVKADRDFEMLVIPGAGHGSAESPYGRRRRADFFVRHLLGVEPRAK